MGRVSVELKTAILRYHPNENHDPRRVLDFIKPYTWSAPATVTQNGHIEISGMVATEKVDCEEAVLAAPRHAIKTTLLDLNDMMRPREPTPPVAIWYHLENGVLVPYSWPLVRAPR